MLCHARHGTATGHVKRISRDEGRETRSQNPETRNEQLGMNTKITVWLIGIFLSGTVGLPGLELKKVADEMIAVIPSADNGASPLWCFGSSIFVRDGEDLYLSLLQTDLGLPPNGNCHWEIWKRTGGQWRTLFRGGEGMEREPCPLLRMAPGELILSTQSKVMEKPFQDGKGASSWYSKPGLTGIFPDEEDNDAVYHHYHPVFQDGAQFSDTSYRGIGIDPGNREILLLVIDQRGDENFQVSWLRSDKGWKSLTHPEVSHTSLLSASRIGKPPSACVGNW